MAVVIETTLGDITVDLYLDQRPVTCLNFLKLCKMKYYNYNLFHTIRSGFIAQTGDPTGEGSGGQSIFGVLEGPEKRFFSGEKMPKIRHTDTGLLSMVGTGDMMIGSQFYFTLGSDLDSLDGIHCVIGEVTEGHEVLRKLNEVICDETHRPYQDVRITHTVILADPFNDPPGLRAPSRSPSPSAERLKGGRIAPDEELDETQGKTYAEVQELIEEKEAKARATILEIVGDLPDADIAPPENVLFVCKLNPITIDEDLEIIFSRFGKIVSCEVIRDKKTGDSLQYAFIEFDDKKSCEEAYLKMDNVLIDDRRIHVDFSQSVSKMKWLGKGRGVKYFNEDNSNDEHNVKDKKKRSRSRERDRIDHKNNRNDYDKYRNKRHENGERKREYEKNRDRDARYEKDSREKSRRDRSRSRSKLQDFKDKSSRNDKNYRHNNFETPEKVDNNHKRKQDTYKQDDKQRDKHYYKESNTSLNKSDKSELSKSSSRKKTDNQDMSSLQDQRNKYDRHRKNEERKSYKDSDTNKTSQKGNEVENKVIKDKMHHKDTETESQRDKKDKSKREYREPITPPVTREDKTCATKKKRIAEKVTKKEKGRKKRKPSTSSSDSDSSDSTSTSSDSSSSSDSERVKKTVKRRKKKHSSSSSSSSESSSTSSSTSSDSSSSSSTSSDSESNKKKRHKKNLKLKKPTKPKKKL